MITIMLTGAYSGGSSYDGTYSAGSYPISINIDGAEVVVDSGSVTIVSDNDGNVLISFDLTASVGNKSFTLKANNVLGVQ